MYVPGKMMFRYTSCPKTRLGGGLILIEGLAFAANHARDPELADIAAKAYHVYSNSINTHAKSGGSNLCFIVQGLHELARMPGPTMLERRKAAFAELRSPARRWLPTVMPNPDFEQDLAGWRTRKEYTATRTTKTAHSGRACMRIQGRPAVNNEYVTTLTNTPGSSGEISWLVPGRKYRLIAWVRVDRLAPGVPAPSVRIQFRDASGSRTAAVTNVYDGRRMGVWQKLTCDFAVPGWNTRNYIALNTRDMRGKAGVPPQMWAGELAGRGRAGACLLYLDDVSVLPVSRANADTYATIRLDAGSARCSGATRLKPGVKPLGPGLAGAGTAAFEFEARSPGDYRVFAKVSAPEKEVADLTVDSKLPRPIRGGRRPCWADLGAIRLHPGKHKVTLRITDDKAWIGRIVLTTDPGDSPSAK